MTRHKLGSFFVLFCFVFKTKLQPAVFFFSCFFILYVVHPVGRNRRMACQSTRYCSIRADPAGRYSATTVRDTSSSRFVSQKEKKKSFFFLPSASDFLLFFPCWYGSILVWLFFPQFHWMSFIFLLLLFLMFVDVVE